MIRKLALSILLTVSAFAYSKESFAITYDDYGSSTTYNLTANDSLHIVSGTYTGTISGFPSGARISVSGLAIFQPSSMPNNSSGTMYVYGTSIISQTTFRTNSTFTLNNYGVFTVNANVVMNGNNQTWTNNYGGIINFNGDVLMNGNDGDLNNILINRETVNCSGNYQMNSGSAFTNYKDFTGTGNFRVNGGVLNNEGNLDIAGNILMNNGASVIRNYCRLQASGGITNTSGNFYNYSYVWARNSDIINSANIINSAAAINPSIAAVTTPMIHGRNFTISGGSMTGPCLLYFYGTTTMTGGTMGIAGVTSDTLKMHDITRTQPTQIFDVQSGGTRHPNLIYNAWGVPDSTRNYLLGCSIEVILETPLAINWNYFYVYLSDKTPVLNWSAEYQEGTVFEIQRSYDGRNFTNIKQLPVEVGRSQYAYNDNSVNTNFPIAYYRILAIEPSGNLKFTQTRNVRFNSKPGSLHIFPNPFASNFMIDYNAKENENVIVKIFNASGQQQLVKNISVHKGTNRIQINEALNFSKGVYIIQVNNGSSIIASSKIIKQ